ncbi:MAG: hypothetical protein ACFB20_09090 [Opitutales bacterium]
MLLAEIQTAWTYTEMLEEIRFTNTAIIQYIEFFALFFIAVVGWVLTREKPFKRSVRRILIGTVCLVSLMTAFLLDNMFANREAWKRGLALLLQANNDIHWKSLAATDTVQDFEFTQDTSITELRAILQRETGAPAYPVARWSFDRFLAWTLVPCSATILSLLIFCFRRGELDSP